MEAVTPVLLETIQELQSLPSLEKFALAGGTNLAIRFNHRESHDIDLFCLDIVGINQLESIEKEIISLFGSNNIIGISYPAGKESDQYSFLRLWVSKPDVMIKVEIIQNMKMVAPFEIINGLKLVSLHDIGLFKMVSGSSRAAKKDIYDLDFITDKIELGALFESLKSKKAMFNEDEHKNIFDLDHELWPTENPKLLLKFDTPAQASKTKPIHSNDNIIIIDDHKSWIAARLSWRMKVRSLFRKLNIKF